MSITVVVADDEPLVRSGITMLLRAEPDLDVIAEASDGHEAVALAREHHPDVVLMDVRMPGMDGVTATGLLAEDGCHADKPIKVLILTTFQDDAAVYGALQAGANGFLLKYAAPRDLVRAIHQIAEGDAWIDPAVAGRVIDALAQLPRREGRSHSELLARLTPREGEVLTLMAHGLSNSDIKDKLVLSEATVKTHVSRILMKTGSRDRTQAVVLAYQGGHVLPPSPTRPSGD